MVSPMYVCLCNGYTDSQIKKVVHEGGVSTAEEAYMALGSGFCCGACKDCANEIVGAELPKRTLMAAE
ncbi:(2Fe-2S)-binding protein [Kordiimonas pumila]|uniref:Bacterioferritin-associated ferredoxin n=1 Tax=Kordiimonas pumila TaxID=2161677 RepID=A0ABV7D1N9_9PROT|nr:(2Fe-2S)-binding protein [Kordiimonas pumila]